MNNLITISHNGQPVASSRDIAEHFEKEHRNVLRDIDDLRKDVLNFEQMFFSVEIPDSYGRLQRAYLMNRDGFSLLVMGFTGKSALEWKLKYIEAFNRMEAQIKSPQPMTTAQMFAMQAQVNLEQEQRIKALEASSAETTQTVETVRDALDIMVAPSVTAENWQSQMNRNVRAFCMQTGFDFHKTFQELYAELEASAGVKLGVRVKYARKRLLKAGATQTEIASVSKLSLVAQDRKLREIFNSLFNRMVARYTIGNDLGEEEVG